MSEDKLDGYERVITTIGELQDGDLVKGTDGKWHKMKLLPLQNKQLYRVKTTDGSIVASYDHQWVLYGYYDYTETDNKLKSSGLLEGLEDTRSTTVRSEDNHSLEDLTESSAEIHRVVKNSLEESANNVDSPKEDIDRLELSTVEIYGEIDKFTGWHVGVENGPEIVDVDMLDEGECQCIEVDSEDSQFEVITDEGKRLFTHNCAARFICGRLGGIASQMALGSSLATAIDGSRPGAGIVSINNVLSYVQYYFTNSIDWIKDWYKSHGKDELGYPIGQSDSAEEITLGDDDEEISLSDNDQNFEFDGISKNVISRKEQKFREV